MKYWYVVIVAVGTFVLFQAFSGKKGSSDVAYLDTTATNFFKRSTGWIASDGGLTVPLENGSSLWLMGDSHINDYDMKTGTVPCLFQVRNCALLQPANDWQWQHTTTLFGNTFPGSKSYFKFNPSDKFFVWPGGGVQIKDTIYVQCGALANTGTGGAFGFRRAGNDFFAKIKYPEMKLAGYNMLPDFGGINFGTSLVKNEQDDYVYAYGDKLRVTAADVYVARFPIANPNAAWTFWDGKSWVSDPAKSTPVAHTPSNSVSVCKVKNKFVAFISEFNVGCDQGKRIFVATADSPTGPFTASKSIYSIQDRKDGHSPFFYSVFGHPEFINDKDEILVTYSINGYGKCVVDCVNGRSDPNVYRPRGIRVPLKLIDPSL